MVITNLIFITTHKTSLKEYNDMELTIDNCAKPLKAMPSDSTQGGHANARWAHIFKTMGRTDHPCHNKSKSTLVLKMCALVR